MDHLLMSNLLDMARFVEPVSVPVPTQRSSEAAGDLQRQSDVLAHGLRGEQIEMLKHHADASPQRD